MVVNTPPAGLRPPHCDSSGPVRKSGSLLMVPLPRGCEHLLYLWVEDTRAIKSSNNTGLTIVPQSEDVFLLVTVTNSFNKALFLSFSLFALALLSLISWPPPPFLVTFDCIIPPAIFLLTDQNRMS